MASSSTLAGAAGCGGTARGLLGGTPVLLHGRARQAGSFSAAFMLM